jgi:hypothetical protein
VAREQISGEEFVRHFHQLRDRAGNNPSGVMRAPKASRFG